MKNKKGQIKLIETIAILVVFFFLLTAGIYFFFNFQKSSIIKESDTLVQSDIIKKSISLLTLPELSCTLAQTDITKGCIDFYKAVKMRNIVSSNEEYYFDLLQFSTLRLEVIYPSDIATNITLYNKTKSNYNQKTSVPLPVSIFYPYMLNGDLKPSYVFGVMYLEIYN